MSNDLRRLAAEDQEHAREREFERRYGSTVRLVAVGFLSLVGGLAVMVVLGFATPWSPIGQADVPPGAPAWTDPTPTAPMTPAEPPVDDAPTAGA